MNKAKILTPDNISTDKVDIGTIVTCSNAHGKKENFTILGPWEADPEKNIISFQSKLGIAMKGLKVGDRFSFQNEDLKIISIDSYLK
jgi:transcription elongation GreA/GreB family factor